MFSRNPHNQHAVQSTRIRGPPQNVIDARSMITFQCKHGQFSEAEHTFRLLCDMIKLPLDSAATDYDYIENKKYSEIQILNFRKSISSLVRYAPTIQDSLKYACFCLRQVPEPLRDVALETTITINLIYLYKRMGGYDNMDKALKLTRTGVRFGYALPKTKRQPEANTSFQQPHVTFIAICTPVLKYFGLSLSEDKQYIVNKSP